jgi:spermidine/putrescine transport system permease protein
VATVPLFLAVRALLWRRAVPGGPRYPLQLALPALAYYLAFFVLPLVLVVQYSLGRTPESFGGEVALFPQVLDTASFSRAFDDLYLGRYLDTFRLAGVGTLLTILLGYPLAYWIVRYASPSLRTWLLVAIVVPFWTSFLIRTYAFLIILAPEFVLSRRLQDLGLTQAPLDLLNGEYAVQLGLVYNYLPLLVLPVYASLERMDWRLVEAATDLGASEWAAFRQITLRLTAPGLITGALLVFIPMMGEYVIPQILGGGNFVLIGNLIAQQFLSGQDYVFGSAMALVVMGGLSVFMALYLYLATRTESEYGA